MIADGRVDPAVCVFFFLAIRVHDMLLPVAVDSLKVFDRIRVSHIVTGNSLVTWDFNQNMTDAGPYTYQLYVGHTGLMSADDWSPVGLPVADIWYLRDDRKRLWGMKNWTHYIVAVTSAAGVRYSKPESAQNGWSFEEWRRANEMARKETLAFRMGSANSGYLLKRRTCGEFCDCLDFQTQEVRNPSCPQCFGTGYTGGYHPAVGCVYALFSLNARNPDQNDKGTTDDVVVTARMLNDPQLYEYDVWVDRETDDRYFMREFKSVAEIRGRAIVLNVQLRLIPFGHVIYSLPIPTQAQVL